MKDEGRRAEGGGIIRASGGMRAIRVRGEVERGASAKAWIDELEISEMTREGIEEWSQVKREERIEESKIVRVVGIEAVVSQRGAGVGVTVEVASSSSSSSRSCSSSSSSSSSRLGSSSIRASSARESRGKGD